MLETIEQHLWRALGHALLKGLRLISGRKELREGKLLVAVDVIGAAELDGRTVEHVLPFLPQGASGALADGFDGRPFDAELDGDLRRWHAMGARLRRAYKPTLVPS